MTVASEITRIENNIADAYTAASGKGATLPATENSANLATCISSISGGGGDTVSPRELTAQGVYQLPSGSTSYTLPSSVTTIGNNGLTGAFYGSSITSFDLSSLVSVTGFYGLACTFAYNPSLTSISFPSLTTISGVYAFENSFAADTNLVSVSFPELLTVGARSFQSFLSGCSSITNISFPKLTTISLDGTFATAFVSSGITSISFPSLTTIDATGITSFVDPFNYFLMQNNENVSIYFDALTTASFSGNGGKYAFNSMLTGKRSGTTTIHFPSNLESTIQTLANYPLFGGQSGMVTLVYDLAATS